MCELFEVDWFGSKKNQKAFSGLRRVELKTITNTGSDGEISVRYQVLLLTNTGTIPFTRLEYSKYDSEQFQSVISSINSFLATPLEKSLALQEDDRELGYFSIEVSIFLGLLALLIISSGTLITCTFDKEANNMTLSYCRWFGILGETVIQHPLDDIRDVKIEDSDADEGLVFRVVFLLKTGKILPLTHLYSSGYQYKQQIAKLIKTFLNCTSI